MQPSPLKPPCIDDPEIMPAAYLSRYAEPDTDLVTTLPGQWQSALVTPAYKETGAFLDSHTAPERLLILVVNRPDNDSDTRWAQQLLEMLGAAKWQQAHISLHCAEQTALNGDVLLIDRCLSGPPLPAKQGVGLARKIGCDIACRLHSRQQILCPWIGSSDADALLPGHYDTALSGLPTDAAAAMFPFNHRPESVPAYAVTLYELHMLYYVSGLRFAGSPYAWPTIGSCMAINVVHYQQARGFPKRAAGEDFYLLDKLTKLGGVAHVSNPHIEVSGRASQRVPFGTGPALRKIADLSSTAAFTSYHPASFVLLKAALEALRMAAIDSEVCLQQAARHNACDYSHLRSLWQQFQCDNAIATAWKNNPDNKRRQRALFTWFDGFKCLKWIHSCRSQHPDIPLEKALSDANWLTSFGYSADSKNPVHSMQNTLADNQVRGPASIGPNPARN